MGAGLPVRTGCENRETENRYEGKSIGKKDL
jgi:hypothetical protein